MSRAESWTPTLSNLPRVAFCWHGGTLDEEKTTWSGGGRIQIPFDSVNDLALILNQSPVTDQTDRLFLSLCNLDSLPEIRHLSNIRFLSLSCNVLRTVPELPPNLLVFEISSNALTQVPDLPASLRMLDLSFNSIDTLPDFADCQVLRSILLRGCRLQHVPPVLSLSHLTILELSNNQLSSLPKLILPSLLTLALDSNQLASLPDHLPSDLPSLTSLSISDNQLNSLPHFPNLSRLTLSGNPIRDCPRLPVSRWLNYVDLANTPLGSLAETWNDQHISTLRDYLQRRSFLLLYFAALSCPLPVLCPLLCFALPPPDRPTGSVWMNSNLGTGMRVHVYRT